MTSSLSASMVRVYGLTVGRIRVCQFALGSLVCASLLGWAGTVRAFDVSISASLVRAPTRVSNELFALLTLPLDEWFNPTFALARASRRDPTLNLAWSDAENAGQTPRVEAKGLRQNEPLTPETATTRTVPPEAPPRLTTVPWMPRVDATFLRGLMAACSREFRATRTELSELASRARSSAWLPELQLKGGRNTDETLRLTPTEAEPDRYQLVGGDGVRFEGQIKWSFNQLVFARDELTVARLQGALETEKRRRQHEVMDVLSKWLRVWFGLNDVEQAPDKRVEAWIAERALRAELDWLSQGWFSRHVRATPELAALLAQGAS